MKNKIIGILAVGCFILGALMLQQCDKVDNLNNLIDYKNDSLTVTVDKWERALAEKQSLVVDNNRQLKKLAKENDELKALVAEVRKEKDKVQSAAIVEVETIKEIEGPTVVIDSCVFGVDTVGEWFSLTGEVSSDSFKLTPSFKDRYTIMHTENRRMFKPNQITFKFKNENPYTQVQSVQSYTTKCDCNRGRYFILGAGVGFGGSILLRRLLR